MNYSIRNPERLGGGAVIPPIVHPSGRYWDQPDRSEIMIDATHAIMSKATFDKLLNYTLSSPSGIYEGKMWKSQRWEWDRASEIAVQRGYAQRIMFDEWYLHWFGSSDKPNMVSNNVRRIIIV